MERLLLFGVSQEAALAILTGVFSAIALAMFAHSIIRRRSQPYVWAWLVRVVICTVGFLSQVAGGATYSLALSGCQVAMGLIIISLIVWRRPRLGRLDRIDGIGVMVAVVGLTVWLASGNPLYGLTGALLADAMATFMGIRASLRQGTQDSLAFWACCGSAALTALLAAGHGGLVIWLAPLVSCVNALANIFAIAYVRQRTRRVEDRLEPIQDLSLSS
jgi:hypothetical protein